MEKSRLNSGLKIMFLLLFTAWTLISQGGKDLEKFIKDQAIPLSESSDLDMLISAADGSRLVLLGEASHGTYEYYLWRDVISRRLIAEKDFNFIAVEGDFASLYELNRYVKDMPGAANSARDVLESLDRWPQWMWGNEEVLALAEWLREYNDPLPTDRKVGFYGMDVYDEWRSKDAVLDFLREHDSEIYSQVSNHYSCFKPYDRDSWSYARGVQQGRPDCSNHTLAVVELIKSSRDQFNDLPDSEYFYLLQNAYVKHNAEKFYRKSATRRDASSWNSRVHHMHETVNRLLDLYGEESSGIVWAHNTHIGDARFTDMFNAGNQNIGELSRVYHGPENIFSVGFTTYKGKVMAGAQWGSRQQVKRIASARRNSVEYVMNKTGLPAFYLLFDDEDRTHDKFMEPRGHRAVGVVYNPVNEPRQYVNTILPLRYDAFIFFHETQALNPLR
ncbi:MAG: erythromycin esterase family protein [Bacteroidales bacterium]|nr:erythromycin esterase family protein [Bacteroidales bacterium]